MNDCFARLAIAVATGRTKNGIGAVATRSNTSFRRRGGIADPSA